MIEGPAIHHRRDHKKAEEGNRTLLSLLKTIGRSAVRTRASGQEAPHDAPAGQRYWPVLAQRPLALRGAGCGGSGERTLGRGQTPPRRDPGAAPRGPSLGGNGLTGVRMGVYWRPWKHPAASPNERTTSLRAPSRRYALWPRSSMSRRTVW